MLQQEFGIKKTYLSLHPQSHRRSFTHCNKSEKKLQISFGRFKKGCTFAAPKNLEKTKLKKSLNFFKKDLVIRKRVVHLHPRNERDLRKR